MINRKAVTRKTEELIALFEGTNSPSLRPDATVASLSPDERQIVEILKAISFDPWMIILDEATASLDNRQVHKLFDLINGWKEQGKAIVFVSHRMEEIFEIADRYSVLRNGKTVGSGNIKDINGDELVQLMIEEKSAFVFSRTRLDVTQEPAKKPICLEVNNLHTDVLGGISFNAMEGELIGIGGLQGQGQRNLLLALFGAIPYDGEVNFMGEKINFRNPREAMKKGLSLVPGDRAKEGLL
ncbi:MAG: sugar ABC transporter ATP-binding protein, partial [Anaerolineales bacterium]|nr:sugar ABC transporter ATP-binding protein [Anaerolineales bacterium]